MSIISSKRDQSEIVEQPVDVKRARVENVSPMAPFMKQLEEEGYTVIPNVLSAEKCAEHRASLDAYLLKMNINVHDPSLRQSHYPGIHGIIQHLEVGHSNAAWSVRQEENVTHVFEEIFGDNDLLVSFDGVCVMLPYVRDDPSKRWTHVDQSHKRLGRRCIQGYVNLAASTDERTGSLAVVPGSHKKHSAFAQAHPDATKNNDDWYKFKDKEVEELGCGPLVRVHGEIGSLVLWDSRTAHQNIAPPRSVIEAIQRYVVYVCYQPRSLISKRDLAKKQKAFDDYRMTKHWPSSRVSLFDANWRTYGKAKKAFTIVRDRVETPRMLELAGKTPLTTRARIVTRGLLSFQK